MPYFFNTVLGVAEKSIVHGCWKPLFKYRSNNNYRGATPRGVYETQLHDNIFGNNDSNLVMMTNKYPFLLGENVSQKIIWVRDPNNDPGIETIDRLVTEMYPNHDRIIVLNTEAARSIKSILHYHIILRNPSQMSLVSSEQSDNRTNQIIHMNKQCKPSLKKLLVIYRHGNREPIDRFPIVDKEMAYNPSLQENRPNMIVNAQLIPKGKTAAIRFGRELGEVYFDQGTINFTTLSSPIQRCIDTALGVTSGLFTLTDANSIIHPIIYEPLLFKVPRNILQQFNATSIAHQWMIKHQQFIDLIYLKLGIKITHPSKIYSVYSSLICYKDQGINMDLYLSLDEQKHLESITQEAYHIYNHYLIDHDATTENILNSLWNSKSTTDLIDNAPSLILACSHDTYIYALATLLARKNKCSELLELPDYLSNIRIESWSDGITRVYYNNLYLGNIF